MSFLVMFDIVDLIFIIIRSIFVIVVYFVLLNKRKIELFEFIFYFFI